MYLGGSPSGTVMHLQFAYHLDYFLASLNEMEVSLLISLGIEFHPCAWSHLSACMFIRVLVHQGLVPYTRQFCFSLEKFLPAHTEHLKFLFTH